MNLPYFQEKMIKENPIKIGEEEKLEKEANQEILLHSPGLLTAHNRLSTGLSTTLNREEAQIRFSTGTNACRYGPVDSPLRPVDSQKPKIGF